jgi:hypothetical protein
VLVPEVIDVKFILGAYVCNLSALSNYSSAGAAFAASVNGHLFFL